MSKIKKVEMTKALRDNDRKAKKSRKQKKNNNLKDNVA